MKTGRNILQDVLSSQLPLPLFACYIDAALILFISIFLTHCVFIFRITSIYKGRLQSSWTHLITQNRNFVEVRRPSLSWSTSLGKRYTSYNAPPTSRKRAEDRWSLRNVLPRSSIFMVRKGQKSHGARSELNSVFGLEKVDRWNPIRTSAIQSRSRPMRFLGFSNHEKWAPRQEISKWSTVCSTFSRNGWSVVRSASFAKRGTWKKRPSPLLYKVSTRSNKVSPRTLHTALVHQLCSCLANLSGFTIGLAGKIACLKL
jgi:hypothetical protein